MNEERYRSDKSNGKNPGEHHTRAVLCGVILLIHIAILAAGVTASSLLRDSMAGAAVKKLFQAAAGILPVVIYRLYAKKLGTPSQSGGALASTRRAGFADRLLFFFIAFAVICAGLQLNIMLCEVLSDLGIRSNPTVSGTISLNGGFWGIVLSVLLYVLVPAVFEELFFRYALFNTAGCGAAALVVTSVCFAFSHFNPFGLFYTAVSGLVLGVAVLYTGRLMSAILLHAAVNGVALLLSYLSYLLPVEKYAYAETVLWICVLAAGFIALVISFLRRAAGNAYQTAVIPVTEKGVLPPLTACTVLYILLCCAFYAVGLIL